MENPFKMDDLGVTLFLETPIYFLQLIFAHQASSSFNVGAPTNKTSIAGWRMKLPGYILMMIQKPSNFWGRTSGSTSHAFFTRVLQDFGWQTGIKFIHLPWKDLVVRESRHDIYRGKTWGFHRTKSSWNFAGDTTLNMGWKWWFYAPFPVK